jgi:hypothetical protein
VSLQSAHPYPLLCGLVTGFGTGFKPSSLAKLLVSAAMYQLPLSVSQSIVLGGLPFEPNFFSTACII